jgi:hypothetical protein
MKYVLAAVILGELAAGARGNNHVAANVPNGVPAIRDSVWFWFASCGGPVMTVEIWFDRHLLSQTTTPLCKATRSSTFEGGEHGAVSYTFIPGRRIVWRGYRNNHDTTRASERITGDIWQAGADSGDILLGVSFMAPSRITMNTIHIAHPTRADTSVIASGLAVITYPGKPLR